MIQISEKRFLSALDIIKEEDFFKKFVRKVQDAMDNYIEQSQIIYNAARSKLLTTITARQDTPNINAEVIGANSFYKSYLNIIKDIEKIITLPPSDLEALKTNVDAITEMPDAFLKKQFFQDIEEILNYEGFREKIIPTFYNLLGIKTCVYCNTQHTIFLKVSKKGRYQADHNISKSDYPCFAVTLSNLYPSCNNCNHLKSKTALDFRLYYKDIAEQVNYKAYLEEKDIIAYLKDGQFNDDLLTVHFKDMPKNYKTVIHLDEIYDCHKDYIGDLIHKKKVYTEAYKRDLTNNFKKLFPSSDEHQQSKILDRLIYGSFLDEDSIHKRVFAKLNFDIYNQLNSMSPDTFD